MSRVPKQLQSGEPGGASAVVRPRPDGLASIAQAAAGGDPEASATLVLHVGAAMLRVVRKVLGRRHPEVDDTTQDAVIALLQALPAFRGESTIARFAQRIALLTALAARRRMRFRERHREGDDAALEETAGDGASPLAATVAGRRRRAVRRLLDELPDPIAEALGMHFVLGYTVDEIAAAAAVPPNTVWSRLRLGKQALRRKLIGDARLAEILEVAK